MKIVVFLVVLWFVVSGGVLVAQEAKKPVAAKPPAAAVEEVKPIALTAEEAKDLELNQKDQQILELQIDKLQNQVATAKQNLAKDTAALTERLVKAHNIDLTKFTLDVQGKQFVPVAGKRGK